MKNEACLRHKKNYGRGSALFRSESFYPQNWLFCVGKFVDYKRRSVGRFRGRFFRRRDGAPNKTLRFCSSARRSGRLRRPGERLAARHRRLTRDSQAESLFPLRTESRFYIPTCPQFRITHYALRILVNNRSLVGGGYHPGVSLKIACNAVFLLNRHFFFALFDFLVGNL